MCIVKVEGSVWWLGGWCGVFGMLGGFCGLCCVLVLVWLGWFVGKMDVMVRDIGEGGLVVVCFLFIMVCVCVVWRS